MNFNLSEEDQDAAPCAASSGSIDASTNVTAALSDQVSHTVRMLHIVQVLYFGQEFNYCDVYVLPGKAVSETVVSERNIGSRR